MKREIIEFLEQNPQYNDTAQYIVESRATSRYGGDYEILVWEKFDEGESTEYVGCWWCQLWNNEAETTYIFEKEKEVKVMSMQVCVDSPIYLGEAHYNYDENDPRYYTDIEDAVIKKYTEDNLENVKQMLCEKIMSGEIPITIYSNDSDCWDAPIKQVEKRYKIYNV